MVSVSLPLSKAVRTRLQALSRDVPQPAAAGAAQKDEMYLRRHFLMFYIFKMPRLVFCNESNVRMEEMSRTPSSPREPCCSRKEDYKDSRTLLRACFAYLSTCLVVQAVCNGCRLAR